MELAFLLQHQRPGKAEVKSLGFYRSRSAAEAAIKDLCWQPDYRDHPEGFSIDECELDKTVRFANKTGAELELVVELWATSVIIPAGSEFAIHYPAPTDRDDTSFAELQEGVLTFWCEGATFEVDVDGVRIAT